MKKTPFIALFALATCFGFGCGQDGSPNYSTPTEKIGSGEGDPIENEPADTTDQEARDASDSAELSTGAPETAR